MTRQDIENLTLLTLWSLFVMSVILYHMRFGVL